MPSEGFASIQFTFTVFQAGVLGFFYSLGLGQAFKGGIILTSQMSPGKARGSSPPLQVTTWSLIIGIQSFSQQF